MYYKNNKNQPYYEPSETIIKRDGLVEITKEEFEQVIVELNTPTSIQLIEQKIAEAKAYLSSTDFYMTVDKYAELDEARKVELTAKRAEARELINTLEAELGNI